MNPARPILVDLNIGNQLTSTSCGHIVVELIKFIAYQRLQIPYTYQWLKLVVNKKKMSEKGDERSEESFQSERYYRVASTALESLDFILKSLHQEINCSSIPEEICVTFGATPVTCKEVYRLLLPMACHKPQCHSSFIANDDKIQKGVFKTLVTSEQMSQMFSSTLPPTNMYVFIKKIGDQETVLDCSNFMYTSGYRIPRNSRIVVINFRTKNDNNIACCNDFKIYSEVVSENVTQDAIDINCDKFNEIESTDDVRWYQSSYVMKGFKDCVVNGSSISNSWLDS